VNGEPFLFPKLVEPTSATAPIAAGDALLDYEVELGLVTLQPTACDVPATGGLILCNDVTDRAKLLRNVDPKNPQSGRGFTSGKSGPGFLPVGNLFVVPRDLRTFVDGLTLQLSVNGRERQRGAVTRWIWDLDEILRQSWLRRDVRWDYWGGVARLPFIADGWIPARTLLLAGTPAGTVWKGMPRVDYARGTLDWLVGGTRSSVVDCIIERHIRSARNARGYLQPGDVVTAHVDRLGRLANAVL
jgi:2,4-diketo-3-deoxy-L-fuconate hydrolase